MALFNPADSAEATDSNSKIVPREVKAPPGDQPAKPASPVVGSLPESIQSEKCEITHKDAISALSRATTKECKNRIEETYC